MIKLDSIKNKKQRGAVAVLLTLLIIVVVLVITLGLSIIFANEIKTTGFVSRSAPAFYAADAGAEYALYQIFKKSPSNPNGTWSMNLYGGAAYVVCWGNSCSAGSCPGAPRCLNSSGTYSQTKRKVELTWGP